MTKYRKRPVEVDAHQWTGDNFEDVTRFLLTAPDFQSTSVEWAPEAGDDTKLRLYNTKERQWINCPVGHWIIRGVHGEMYPCDPAIFGLTYDPVEPAAENECRACGEPLDTTNLIGLCPDCQVVAN